MTALGRIYGKLIAEDNLISFASFLNVSKHPMILDDLGRRCGMTTSDCGDTEFAAIELFARLKKSDSSY